MIILIEHDVAWFQITVYNLHAAQVLEAHHDLRGDVLGELVVEALLALQEVQQAAPIAQLDQQVQLVLILKGLIKLYDRNMVQARQNASLDKNFFDAAFADEAVYEHFFESVGSLGVACDLRLEGLLLELDFENSAVSAIPNFGPSCEVSPNERSHLQLAALSCAFLRTSLLLGKIVGAFRLVI